MDQTTFTAQSAGRTQNERVLHCLQEHAPSWVAMPVLWRASGAMAVHSRIADLRKAGHHIEQHSERKDGVVHSSYRLLPAPRS